MSVRAPRRLCRETARVAPSAYGVIEARTLTETAGSMRLRPVTSWRPRASDSSADRTSARGRPAQGARAPARGRRDAVPRRLRTHARRARGGSSQRAGDRDTGRGGPRAAEPRRHLRRRRNGSSAVPPTSTAPRRRPGALVDDRAAVAGEIARSAPRRRARRAPPDELVPSASAPRRSVTTVRAACASVTRSRCPSEQVAQRAGATAGSAAGSAVAGRPASDLARSAELRATTASQLVGSPPRGR